MFFCCCRKDNNWKWQDKKSWIASIPKHNKNSNKFNATQQTHGRTLGHVRAANIHKTEDNWGTKCWTGCGSFWGVGLFLVVCCLSLRSLGMCDKVQNLWHLCASMHCSYAAWSEVTLWQIAAELYKSFPIYSLRLAGLLLLLNLMKIWANSFAST